MYNDDRIPKKMRIHRIVALTFIPNPDNKPQVNHIDGNKFNNDCSNLEWATVLENTEHAGNLGISPKCLPILVKDIDTEKVIKFPSIISCARHFGVSKDSINYRVKLGPSRIFPERKQYRYYHSKDTWYTPEEVERCMLRNGVSKKIMLKNLCSGEIIEFKKISNLAKHLKLAVSTISSRMKKQPVLLKNHIQLKWAWDKRPWVEYDEYYKKYNIVNLNTYIEVVNSKTASKKYYNGIKECCEDKNLLPTALNYRLKSNGKTIFSDDCTYKYC